jgi:thiol:disulfide interchange protein DsbA
MKFLHTRRRILMAGIASALTCDAFAQSGDAAGRPRDYDLIKGSWPAGEADVVEFFSYNCNYCSDAEPFVAEFLRRKPASLVFERYAVSSGKPGWALSAEAFRATHLAGMERKLAPALFERMVVQQAPFDDLQAIRQFFEREGVGRDVTRFVGSAESDALRKRISELARGLPVERTPSFVVGGRFVAYWGSHHTPESFAELLLALHRRTQEQDVAGCKVAPDSEEPAPSLSAACRR